MMQDKSSAPNARLIKESNLTTKTFLPVFAPLSCRTIFGKTFAAMVFCLFLAGIAAAQISGSLDATFGAGGKVVTPVAVNDGIYAIAVQADGKIIAAGYASEGANTDFALVRYNTDGTLDATFGTGGKVITPIGNSDDFASAVAVQADGKIIAAGSSYNGSNSDFALVRYNANGTLDATFGTGGKVVTPIGNFDDFINGIAIQTNGKIVVGGTSEASAFNNDFALARYNTDGTLDTTFGTGGKVVTPIGSSNDSISGIAIQIDGKIVAAGYASNGTNDDFALARYNSDGTLDAAFGAGGKVITPIGNSDDFASGVAIQTDGKIVVVGDAYNGANADFALARYNQNGTLDTTFGTGGKVITPVGSSNDFASGVALQADGKIVAAGYSYNGANADFSLVRFNQNGTLDTAFGTGGKVITPIGNSDDFAFAVAVQADGKIVAAGSSNNGSNMDFALARYHPENLNNPVPSISAIVPAGATAGSGAFELTVNGNNFIPGSIVRWNGADRTTTFVSETQLKAQILASDIQTPGQFPVTVFNPTPGGGLSNAVVFQVFSCSYSLDPTSQNFASGGGAGSTNVTTAAGCAWTAVSNAAWITITGGASGNGNGTVSFSVAANSGPARSGTITVNGQTFTVNQASGCAYSLSAMSFSAPANGAAGNVNVTTAANCMWSAASNAPWITITAGSSGSGNGSVSFSVAANTGPARSGTITIAGQTFTVNQASGCAYSLSASTFNASASAGNGNFSVTSGDGCAWTAVSNAAWITITGGASGNGNGTVSFSVAANSGPARLGTITVNGQTFTVNQASGCAYSLSASSFNAPANGGGSSVNVTSGNGCSWTAVSNAAWITITDGANGSGNGTVSFSIAANGGPARSGTITVAGQTFTVNQASGCAYLLSAASFNAPANAGNGNFGVTSGDGCTWTAVSNAAWITITSGGNGSGNGTGSFSFGANTGAARSGTITIAGQTFTVNQAAATAARTAYDFDGDGKADISVFRPSNGAWYLLQSQNGFTAMVFGLGTDKLVPGDYDGDGKTDIAVFREGIWYLQRSQLGFTGVAFGFADDIPVPGDYDGDGKTDIAVFRPSNGAWYLLQSSAGFTGMIFGISTDKPVPADYDGDGKTDVAVNREGTWYLMRSSLGFTAMVFGDGNDKLVPADYDGDGKADIAVFRPSNGVWYLMQSSAGFTGVAFGLGTDKPVAADYDGDGKADIAVYRDGIWYLLQSTAGFTGAAFGEPTDKPIPHAFVP